MTFPPIETPFRFHEETVRPEWIDGNGHMTAWEYHTAFRVSMRKLFSVLGLGLVYREQTGRGIFLLDYRVQYLREVMEGMRLAFDTQLLDHDEKVIHYLVEMRAEGYVAATCEALEIQMDLETRRPTPMPEELQAYLTKVLKAHKVLRRPHSLQIPVGIRRKS